MQNGSHLWQLSLQKRKEGRCPLEPGEVAVILRAMGYPKETQIYVASGQVYGGQNRMAPLRNMFPNLVSYFALLRTLSENLHVYVLINSYCKSGADQRSSIGVEMMCSFLKIPLYKSICIIVLSFGVAMMGSLMLLFTMSFDSFRFFTLL